jgi:3-hydroxyisobutyrate dehydrogenase
MRIGFIGLGNMGGPMAANLVKAGHAVTGFDMVPAALEKLKGAGGVPAPGAAAVVKSAELVITMLPAGRHVDEVYCHAAGVLDSAAPGTLLIDCSTIDVDTARAVAAAAKKRGFAMLDAPVSGGVGGATSSTLTFMVGGDSGAFARGEPILKAMGKTIVHAGASGAGQAAKICNNLMLGISMIGTCESFALADKLGLDRQKLFDISSKSSGQSWSMTSYCPAPGPVPNAPSNRDYQAGFTADMMLKDLKLAAEAAKAAGANAPLGLAAADLYQRLSMAGLGAKDFSVMYRFLAEN